MCQDAGEKKKNNNYPEIPFSFDSPKTCFWETQEKSFDLLIPPPEITLVQDSQFGCWMDTAGLSLCWDEGSSCRTGDRDRFGYPQVKQEISGVVKWWRLPAGPGRFPEIRKWSSQKKKIKKIKPTKQREPLRDGGRRLTLCLVSVIWSLASEDSQVVFFFAFTWLKANRLCLQHSTWAQERHPMKEKKNKNKTNREYRFIYLSVSSVYFLFIFSPGQSLQHQHCNTSDPNNWHRPSWLHHSALSEKANIGGQTVTNGELISMQVAAFLPPLQLFFFS